MDRFKDFPLAETIRKERENVLSEEDMRTLTFLQERLKKHATLYKTSPKSTDLRIFLGSNYHMTAAMEKFLNSKGYVIGSVENPRDGTEWYVEVPGYSVDVPSA